MRELIIEITTTAQRVVATRTIADGAVGPLVIEPPPGEAIAQIAITIRPQQEPAPPGMTDRLSWKPSEN